MAVTKDQSLLIANEGQPQLFAILQETKNVDCKSSGGLYTVDLLKTQHEIQLPLTNGNRGINFAKIVQVCS